MSCSHLALISASLIIQNRDPFIPKLNAVSSLSSKFLPGCIAYSNISNKEFPFSVIGIGAQRV